MEDMVHSHSRLRWILTVMVVGAPMVLASQASAASADVSSIESFMRSIIQMLAGLAGLVATGFFVVGGFSYITSSGNPEHLDRAKRTIMWAAVGLAITVGAFVLSNIVTTLATNAFGN